MARDAALRQPPGGDSGRDFENLTLWQRVYEHLREEILSNRLPAGTELQEVVLSQQLGVSRGPIRESIGRLAAEGLVLVRPRRGAVVRSLSRAEFLEAYQVREALEMMAVRLAVPRLSDEDFSSLQGLIDSMEGHAERGDVVAFFEANVAFHAALFEMSGNRKLEETYRQILGQMGRYRMRSLALRGNLQRSVAEHRAILRAARRGDVERAVHLISEHIRVPQRRIESLSDEDLHIGTTPIGGRP
jgi:DNA-binding GntR family transcriptional regulator